MAIDNISQDLADLLVTRNFDPKYTDEKGQDSAPGEAKTFSFDYTAGSGKNYGTAVVVLGNDNDLSFFFGDNLGRSIEDPSDKDNWFAFLQELSNFATQHRYTFSPKDLNRLKHTMQGMAAIKEGLFEGYYGTRRVSYVGEQTDARLVIKHNRIIGKDDKRYRYVESLFIETADNERFKLPFTKLSAGRAMLEHVRQGGRPYDIRGQHINEVVQEMAVLSRFNRASQQRVFEGVTQELVESAQYYYASLQENLKSLAHSRGYSKYFESWTPADISDQTALVEDLKTMFVEQTIDVRIEAALPTLARIQQKGIAMKEAQIFENWINHLAEGTWALPETPEQRAELEELMSSELIVGPDATNATEQLYDLVGDDELFDILSDLAQRSEGRANCWDDSDVQQRLAELGIQLPDNDADQPEDAEVSDDKAPAQQSDVAEGDPKSHQAQTTLKHLKKASYGDRADAANIRPGTAGYRDRMDMLKRAEKEGNLKDQGVAEGQVGPTHKDWAQSVQRVKQEKFKTGDLYNRCQNVPYHHLAQLARDAGLTPSDEMLKHEQKRKAKGVAEGRFTVNAKTGARLDPRTGAELPRREVAPKIRNVKSQHPKFKDPVSLNLVWRKVEDVVAQIYPDGDPIDWLMPWFKKQGIEDYKIGEILEKAARAHGYKDIYAYWDSMEELPTSGPEMNKKDQGVAEGEDNVCSPTDEEYRHISGLARKAGIKLDGLGVDKKTGNINWRGTDQLDRKVNGVVKKVIDDDGEYMQGMAEGEQDNNRMNSQHQDFYNKNPNFKRNDRETKVVGNRLATQVKPNTPPEQVQRKPTTPFGVAEDQDAVDDYLARGGKIQQGKYHKPRKAEEPGFGSKHIGGQRDSVAGKAGKSLGLGAKTNFKGDGNPVVAAESQADFDRMLKLAAVPIKENVLTDDTGHTLNHIIKTFGREVRDFKNGGDISDDLFHALYDYYEDDMPYGTRKARDGDPFIWISNRFARDLDVNKSNSGMTMPEGAAVDAYMMGKSPTVAHFADQLDNNIKVQESTCNYTTEGEYCPKHGLAECSGMYEMSTVSGGMAPVIDKAPPDNYTESQESDRALARIKSLALLR